MFDNYNAVNCDITTGDTVYPSLDLSMPVRHTAVMTDAGLQRLAVAVRERRQALGLAQGDLASRGGPSIVTVGKIERAAVATPPSSTLQRLDRALGWATGSAAGVLAGGEPQELARENHEVGADIIAAIEREPALQPIARAHLINQLEILLRLREPVEQVVAEEQERRRQVAEVEQRQQQQIRQIKAAPPLPAAGRPRKA